MPVNARDDFCQLAEAAFAALAQRNRLRPIASSPQRLELASDVARLSISLERDDLFVAISTTEDNPIRRFEVSLPELLAGAPPPAPPALPRSSELTLKQRLETAAALLAHYEPLLAGDFSIRSRIYQYRAREWLGSKYHDIVEARLYATLDEGLRQVKWEYLRFKKPESEAVFSELERWLESDDPSRREFAERVLAAL